MVRWVSVLCFVRGIGVLKMGRRNGWGVVMETRQIGQMSQARSGETFFFMLALQKHLCHTLPRVKTVTQQITFQDNAQMLGGAKQNSRCGKYSCDSWCLSKWTYSYWWDCPLWEQTPQKRWNNTLFRSRSRFNSTDCPWSSWLFSHQFEFRRDWRFVSRRNSEFGSGACASGGTK